MHAGDRRPLGGGRRAEAILSDVSGQDLAEYAVLIGGIALLVIGTVAVFGQQLLGVWQRVIGTLPF